MIQHMNLVFQAGGLTVGEGAFLMACANHTDDRGYVIAHMRQLADEAHMSLRTAQSTRAKLEQRGLVKAAPRFSPKNGAQIANLFRINLDRLAQMRRKRTDYGPTLVEELTFEAPEENPRSDPHADFAPPHARSAPPHADFAPPHADFAGGGGARSAPLLPPSSAPSSLSPGAGTADASVDDSPVGERESEAAPEGQTPSGAEVPEQRERSGQAAAAGRIVDAYAAALGRPVLSGTRRRLESQAVELLKQGLPEGWLCERARELAARGWSDLVRHAERSTAPIEGQRAEPGARRGLPEWCGECGEGTAAARLNPRFRTLGELGGGELCPRCHPDRVAPVPA
ncbi:hypothetical protein SUDANB58_05938 (plasmid) [Streptomyces sp. enrichment culture]|uniref:hypothetical protein n=1 Tax=Streptomyces sp. enrichment culture TaxID=1795815 RepID=UPI003F56250C